MLVLTVHHWRPAIDQSLAGDASKGTMLAAGQRDQRGQEDEEAQAQHLNQHQLHRPFRLRNLEYVGPEITDKL